MLFNKKNSSLFLFFCFLTWKIASSTPASYDQRQTGDVNVQIHLKDVQVVALVDKELLEDYMDYDYAYDYADFTIKPITKPTTSSGISGSTTVLPWLTWPTIAPSRSNSTTPSKIEDKNSTLSSTETSNSTILSIENVNSTISSTENLDSTLSTTMISLEDILSTEKDNKKYQKSSNKACRDGYHKNAKGRCRKNLRRRLSFLPFALRVTPGQPEGLIFPDKA